MTHPVEEYFNMLPFKYAYADFMHTHGKIWTPRALPEGIQRGTARECYKNATDLAVLGSYSYVEGYGVGVNVPLPLHHAWVVDEDGYVLDPTWEEPENCFFWGVKVPLEKLTLNMRETGTYGVFDNGMGFAAAFARDHFEWDEEAFIYSAKRKFA